MIPAGHGPAGTAGAAGERLREPHRGALAGAGGSSVGVQSVHAALLARLHLQITRRLDGLLQGDYLGLLPGPGSEAGESREYRPGDDVRRMDWPVTARTTVPHVRLTEADRELETWLAIDASASLDFGTARMRKWDLALAAAAAMTHLTVRGGNRVGAVICTGGEIRHVPARGGRRGAQALLHVVAGSLEEGTEAPRSGRTGTANLEPQPGRADLGELLDCLLRPPRRRGLVVVISDFLPGSACASRSGERSHEAPEVQSRFGRSVEPWQRPLARLSVRHDLLAVEVVDPRELELPPVGVLEVADPETGQVHEVEVDERFAEAYAQAAAAQRAEVAAALRSVGAAHLRLSTDRDWLLDIVNFVAARRGHRRGSSGTASPAVRPVVAAP